MKFYSASKPFRLITMLLNFAHASVCFDTLFPGSDCSLPPLLLKGFEGDGKKGGTKNMKNKKEKAKALPWGELCQNRPIVLSLHGYFNKSILICYIINNNLIKNPKYSIVSFLC